MSFGFSVGDIVVLVQLSYRLYSAVTSGRNALRDLKELEQALFGLHCSLSHLENTAAGILQRAFGRSDPKAKELKEKLDIMIASCSVTLQEVDDVTRKYRDVSIKENVPRSPRAQIKAQYRKVVWDLKGRSLSEYRQRLQSHTDAINLILTTFIWSDTDTINDNSKKQVEMLDALLNQTKQSNDKSYELLKGIYSMLGTESTASRATLSIEDPPAYSMEDMPVRLRPNATQFAIANPAVSAKDTQQGKQAPSKPKTLLHAEKIQKINAERSLVGRKEFEAFLKKYEAPQVPSMPSFIDYKAPSVQQLHDGIDYILRPVYSVTGREMESFATRKQEVANWVHGLDYVSTLISGKSNPGVNTPGTVNELAKVLVHLNNSLEESDDKTKELFYMGSDCIDQVLSKLQRISRRCTQAIEEFDNERTEWLERQVV